MNDLVAWLRARLDEDERVAQAAASDPAFGYGGRWAASDHGDVVPAESHGNDWVAVGPWGGDLGDVGRHMAHHDPARVLADLDAKRRLLELHPYAGLLSAPESCESCAVIPGPCPTLRLLALPYAPHPDYREEWKP